MKILSLFDGWTCEVIKHLIESCLNEKETDFDEQWGGDIR